jgi:hypothetical protein
LAYLAAYDVDQAQVFGHCSAKTGIDPFMTLVEKVMTAEPYASAKRVFWVVDNGSSHRGKASIDRLAARFPNAFMVHIPVHASWLNQGRSARSHQRHLGLPPHRGPGHHRRVAEHQVQPVGAGNSAIACELGFLVRRTRSRSAVQHRSGGSSTALPGVHPAPGLFDLITDDRWAAKRHRNLIGESRLA